MAQYFLPLRRLLNTIASLDADRIALEIARQKPLQDFIIELNTQDQLYNEGEDSLGQKLKGKTIVRDGQYSPLTISIKKVKQQPTNRVTLFDTGDFYASFKVEPYLGGFRIVADPEKDDTNLFDEFGKDIVGLNNENLQLVIEYFKREFITKINQRLRAA